MPNATRPVQAGQQFLEQKEATTSSAPDHINTLTAPNGPVDSLYKAAQKDLSTEHKTSYAKFKKDRQEKVDDIGKMIRLLSDLMDGLDVDLDVLEDVRCRCISETLKQLRLASAKTFKTSRDLDSENVRASDALRFQLKKVSYEINALHLQIQRIRSTLHPSGDNEDQLVKRYQDVCCNPSANVPNLRTEPLTCSDASGMLDQTSIMQTSD
uniref:Uncharacterized protein n=1 Tax=Chromera velia CCMP2878 TaxID=1169474 RepID=A0A0G4I2H4_9ALVE|eukprot:Cvel_10395.t1-p1 / transcript=Cvel_10395.t1 / gene=Cvel_10395 / organism=Chromera_velia_CCMP2878 / gene_product=hypothetical protein / transcript_product=hypothetical protein / location=Cvel_scaffold626:66034-69127(-) / protein_length=210 / sequence_SO=supercontig / SO=protein_coding / is_pseudo=false